MLKFGYITEIDMAAGQARVFFTEDDIVSNPLPISVAGSKEDKYSLPFAINEQVWCLMDENCEFGVIGGAIYSAKDKPPAGAGKDKIVININNKSKISIDRVTGDVELSGSGKLKIENTASSLKEIIDLFEDYIENIKLTTPAGPTVNLIYPTPVQITDLKQKISDLLK